MPKSMARATGPGQSASGSGRTVRCSCKSNLRRTKETIASGLRIIRVRFSLPKGELPDLEASELSRYLLFLLAPREGRPSLPFPRSQSGWDGEGFPIYSRLGRRSRWLLAHSLSSIKRVLTFDACKQHPPPSVASSWSARACQASPPTSSPAYLEFCRRITREVFSFGWDRELYPSFCDSFVPKWSSRFNAGEPSAAFWMKKRSEYLRFTLAGGEYPPGIKGRMEMRYREVPTVGKVRPMGIPSVDYDLLGPLHKSIYERLRTKEWLLSGPPTAKRIAKICQNRFQTSVDLTNATDGLRLDATESILGVILAKAESIPGAVRLLAARALRPTLIVDKFNKAEVTHGQMMGTYLSFPLLCLSSYCAARWACRDDRDAKILVNGDDVLISSKFKLVKNNYDSGFQINSSKTGVFENVAELNSTCFLRQGGVWKEVRHLKRGGGMVDEWGGVLHLATACRKAGGSWVSAFVRSRIGKKRGLRPTDLGLPLSNRDVWQRERMMTRRLVIPTKENSADVRLEALYEEQGYAEKFALRELLFNEGRVRPCKNEKVVYLNKCKVLTDGRRRRFGAAFDRYLLSGRAGLAYANSEEERLLDSLLLARRGAPREIKCFGVRDLNFTIKEKSCSELVDGERFLSDPNRWW